MCRCGFTPPIMYQKCDRCQRPFHFDCGKAMQLRLNSRLQSFNICENCFILRNYYSMLNVIPQYKRNDMIQTIKYQFMREELILRGRMQTLKLVKREQVLCLNLQGIPINMFINNINLKKLNLTVRNELNYTKPWGCILIDPPWNVGKKNPMRGVNLLYPTMESTQIYTLNLSTLQPFS